MIIAFLEILKVLSLKDHLKLYMFNAVSPQLSYRAVLLVGLLPWSGGAAKRGMPQNLACLLLLAPTTDPGGEDLTVTGDRDTCKVETSL